MRPSGDTPLRLNKYLALCGLGSRRAVESLIRDGVVSVDGSVVTDLSRRISAGESVRVMGRPAVPPRKHVHIMFNKPAGYLCSRTDPHHRPVIYDLLPPEMLTLHYVGRLDYPSRGLLLLTTDGDMTHRLLHPSFEVPRTYRVWTQDTLQAKDLQALREGVEIAPGQLAIPTTLNPTGDHLEITLKEGKKREIRKMLEVLGHEVTDLQRIHFGGLHLGDLPEGKFRPLRAGELATLP